MVARVQIKLALLVISLIVAVISLPVTAAAISMPSWAKPLGSAGSELRAPMRIVSVDDGGFYVSDPRNSGIMKYSPAGVLLKKIKTAGVPQSVAILPDGNLVVTVSNFGYSYACIIDSISGLKIKSLTDGSGQEFRFGFADGVTVDDGVGAAGSIYVLDVKNLKVLKFGFDGVYKNAQFAVNGAALSDIPTTVPIFIAFEKQSKLLAVVDERVTSASANSIRFYTTDGVYKTGVGFNGPAGPLTFSSPQSVSFQYDATNTVLKRMYVVDTFNSTVQVIDPAISAAKIASPVFIGFMGDYGFDATKGELYLPVDAAFDQQNRRLVVVNGKGNVAYFGVDGGNTPSAAVTPPPNLTLDTVYNVVNSPNITLTGSVAAGSAVSCILNGAPVASWKLTGTAWTCTLNNLTAGADNQIMVFAQNASPITETKTANVKYVLNGPYIGVDPVKYYVNSKSLVVKGSTDADTVRVCNPSPTYCVSATLNGSAWSIPGIDLVLGSNNSITVEASKLGVAASQPVHNVIYDAKSPVVKVSMVAHNATVNNQIQNITGQVSDPEGLLDGVTVNSYDSNGLLIGSQQATIVTHGIFSVPMSGVTSYNIVAKDLAGNVTYVPDPNDPVPANRRSKNTINYDPSRVKVWLTSDLTADASVVTNASGQALSGQYDKPLTSLKLYVAGDTTGVNAVLDPVNKKWTARFDLVYDSVTKDGLNDIQVVAEEPGSIFTTSKVTLVYDPAHPEATIVEPKIDIATNVPSYTMKAMDGTAVVLTSTFQGKTDTVASLKEFSVGFDQEGAFPVILSANDSNGQQSQVVRNIIYDKTPPKATYSDGYRSITCNYINGVLDKCVSACPQTGGICNQTTFSGTVEPGASVKFYDAMTDTILTDSVVYTNGGKNWTVTFATPRDPFNTIVKATDAATNVSRTFPVSPDGNMKVDTLFNQDDVNYCMDKVSAYGPKVAPDYPSFTRLTPQELAHGDIGPLNNGNANPDGYIDIVDCLLIVRKLNGYSVSY